MSKDKNATHIRKTIISTLTAGLILLCSNAYSGDMTFPRVDIKSSSDEQFNTITLLNTQVASLVIYSDTYEEYKDQRDLIADAKNILNEYERMIRPGVSDYLGIDPGNEKITILLDNIKDDAYYRNITKDKTIHGLFSPKILGERTILIDINYAWRGLKSVFPTLAHEYAHYLHYKENPAEADFIKEGIAQYIEYKLYKNEHLKNIKTFFNAHGDNNSLTSFLGTPSDYANSYLFMSFLLEYFGGNKLLRKIITSNESGIESVEFALAGKQQLLNKRLLFNSVFSLYSIALKTNIGPGLFKVPGLTEKLTIKSEKKTGLTLLAPYSTKYFQITLNTLHEANAFDMPGQQSFYVGMTRDGKSEVLPTSTELTVEDVTRYKTLSWVVINLTDKPLLF